MTGLIVFLGLWNRPRLLTTIPVENFKRYIVIHHDRSLEDSAKIDIGPTKDIWEGEIFMSYLDTVLVIFQQRMWMLITLALKMFLR